jgi:3-methyladenine DNA glycosylase AlkD
VINARGEVSERATPGWAGYQRHLLIEEGVRFDERGRVDLALCRWDPGRPEARSRPPRRGTAAPRLDPRREVAAIRATLRPLGDPARAAGARAYLKSELRFFGLDAPTLRRAAREWEGSRPGLDAADLLSLAEALWQTPVFELRAFAVEMLVRRRRLLLAPRGRRRILDFLETLLRRSRTWAFVDWIVLQLVAPLIEGDPRLLRRLDLWIEDPDFWIRRSALLALLPALRQGAGDWPRFVRYADAQLAEREFFVRKAIGWVLREVAKKRPALVSEFLAPRLDRVSGLTRREAVKYLPARDRRRLLERRT